MKNKIVVITGGSGTLGNAMVESMLQAGGKVYMIGRNEGKLKAACDRLESKKVDYERGDVCSEKDMVNAMTNIHKKEGRIDVLINCAGGNMPGATIMPDQDVFELSIEDFRKVNDLNLLGTVIPSMAVAKIMAEQKAGTIVNISSMSASLPLTRVVGYSAAKAGVDSFTRWMAVEMATKYGSGIRVNAIAPGFFIADQNKALLLEADGSYTARGNTIIQNTPMRRFGKPEELVSTLLWLCDDRSSFVSGIVVPVDGGFSAFSGV